MGCGVSGIWLLWIWSGVVDAKSPVEGAVRGAWFEETSWDGSKSRSGIAGVTSGRCVILSSNIRRVALSNGI